MLRWINAGVTPPGGWRFFDPAVEHLYAGYDLQKLAKTVREARWNNELEVPPEDLVIAEIIDFTCKQLDGGGCEEYTFKHDMRITVRDLFNGTRVLSSWVADGSPLVNKKIAEQRADICVKCSKNVPHVPCAPCNTLMKAVTALKPKAGVRQECSLKNCAICKCLNAVQVWVPVRHLDKGISKTSLASFPAKCWKRKEITNHREEESHGS